MKREEDLNDRREKGPLPVRLRNLYRANRQIISYLFFGGLSFLVSMGSFALCESLLGLNELLANIISWLLAVAFAFFTNRRWVFDSAAGSPKAVFREAVHFFAGRLGTLAVEELILAVFVTGLRWNALGIKAVAQVIVILLNYIISKYLVFSTGRKERGDHHMKAVSERKRFPVWEMLTAALFSFFMVFGSAFESSGDYRPLFADWGCCLLTIGQFLLWFVLFFVGVSFVFSHWDSSDRLPSGRGLRENAPAWVRPILRVVKGYADLLYRRPIAVAFLTLLIKNIPYFIVSYPGIFMGDVQSQIAQLMGTATVSNHHPLVHTALIGLFLKLHDLIGWNNSIFLYSLLQAMLLLLVLSVCIRTLVRLRCRKWITLSVLLFYLFNPRIENYLFLISKDVIYTSFFVLFVLLLFRFMDKEEKMTRSEWVLFGISVVGMVFFRSEGKLIVIGTMIPALFVKRKPVRRQAAALLLLALLAGSFVTNVVCPAMGAKTITDTKEMLSVPFQQTARYVLEYGDEVTEEERQAIDAVLDYDSLAENYNPSLSDPVKSTYKKQDRALLEYFRVWFQMVCKHPGVYIRATMNNYYQYFYPGTASVGKYTYSWSASSMEITNNANGQTDFSYPRSTEKLRLLLEQYRETFFKSPVLSLVYQSGVYTWLAILCIVYTLRKRSLTGFVCTMPMVVQLLVFITGPTNGYYGRYQFPMMIYLPVALILLPRMLRRGTETKQK